MHVFMFQNVLIFLLYILLIRGISTLWSGVIETFWANNFCAKFFCEYSHYIYRLQEEPTHFGLRIWTNFGLEVLKHFGPKKKNQQNLQRFLDYTKSQNVSIPTNHILLTRTKSNFTTSTNFCQLFLPPCPHLAYSLPLPTKFILTFISKKQFCFSSSEKHQSQHFVGCHPTGINSFVLSFLNDFS